MQLERLIHHLSRHEAFPFPVDHVEIKQTHISVVFLAGTFVYKLKKPVQLGFVDFSTLDKRRFYCDEEVRLNRRLAARVYVGVISITSEGNKLAFEGDGEAVEWAVKMKRLPDDATLASRLSRDEIEPDVFRRLARKLAAFHAGAEGADPSFGSFITVAGNARENFTQSASHIGNTIHAKVFERLRELTEEKLIELQPLLDARAQAGKTRDTHGDLRLEHVYLLSEQPPQDLVVIDCIEFNPRFRFADPVADMAFLVMDLLRAGRRDLANDFADEYFAATGDGEGRALLPFYVAYRAVVRGKVAGMKQAEKEVPEQERQAALAEARGYWLLALTELAPPSEKPCLVLVGGLPGTGKSTIARLLSENAGFAVLRSDVVRKELAAFHVASQLTGFREGIYTPEWTERTYAECLRQAGELLFEGNRAIVDASFGQERHRRMFFDAAQRLGVPAIFLQCVAPEDVIRARLHNRRNDVSDADWKISLEAKKHWQDFGPKTQPAVIKIDTNEEPGELFRRLTQALADFGAC